MILSKEQILAALGKRVERPKTIPILGGEVLLREMGRAQWREAGDVSTVQNGDGKKAQSTDLWHLAIIAAGVVDPDSPPNARRPMLTFEELRPLTEGDDPPLRLDAARVLAQEILDLSEVGPDHLKSGSPAPDAG